MRFCSIVLVLAIFLVFEPVHLLAFGRNIDGLEGIKRVSVKFSVIDSKSMLQIQPFQELLESHLGKNGIPVVKSDLKECLKSMEEYNATTPDQRRTTTCAMAERDWGILYISLNIGSTEKPGKATYFMSGSFNQPVFVRRADGAPRCCLAETWFGSTRSGYTKFQDFETKILKEYLKLIAEQLSEDIRKANGGTLTPPATPTPTER